MSTASAAAPASATAPTVYAAVRASYQNPTERAKELAPGYKLQEAYSNQNHATWFDPQTGKLLFVVAGTHNLSDVGTDALFAIGAGFKESSRYREAKEALSMATRELKPVDRTLVGHSLGGAVARGLASQGDRLITYNSAETIGSTRRPFETTLRTEGDLVSLAGAWRSNVSTLPDRNRQSVLGFLGNTLQAHSSQNLRTQTGPNFFL